MELATDGAALVDGVVMVVSGVWLEGVEWRGV